MTDRPLTARAIQPSAASRPSNNPKTRPSITERALMVASAARPPYVLVALLGARESASDDGRRLPATPLALGTPAPRRPALQAVGLPSAARSVFEVQSQQPGNFSLYVQDRVRGVQLVLQASHFRLERAHLRIQRVALCRACVAGVAPRLRRLCSIAGSGEGASPLGPPSGDSPPCEFLRRSSYFLPYTRSVRPRGRRASPASAPRARLSRCSRRALWPSRTGRLPSPSCGRRLQACSAPRSPPRSA